MKRGQIWISAVLYVFVIVALIALVLEVGLPLIDGLRDQNSFNRAQETMSALDSHIQQIASEGQGSQRVVPISVADGEITVEGDSIRWKIETDEQLVEPGSRQELGNLVITSDVDVTASTIGTFHIMQNSRIRTNFTQVGTESNWTSIDTSALLNNVRFLETNSETSGTFIFTINDSSSQNTGTGYTKLLDTGSGLSKATMVAHVNSSAFEYDLYFTLRSKADFVQISVKNVREK